MEQFRRGLPRRTPFVTVPNFDSDLHDVAGLTRMHRFLFGDIAPASPGKVAAASPGHEPTRASTTNQRPPTLRRRAVKGRKSR